MLSGARLKLDRAPGCRCFRQPLLLLASGIRLKTRWKGWRFPRVARVNNERLMRGVIHARFSTWRDGRCRLRFAPRAARYAPRSCYAPCASLYVLEDDLPFAANSIRLRVVCLSRLCFLGFCFRLFLVGLIDGNREERNYACERRANRGR